MGRPTLPIKSPKRLGNPRRRSAGGRAGSSSSAPGSSSAGGVSANIRVAVRVRPENSREKAGAYNNVINVVDDKMLIFDPKQEGENDFYFHGKKKGRRTKSLPMTRCMCQDQLTSRCLKEPLKTWSRSS